MAITWQNVNSPSNEGVARLMEGAQASVDTGLQGLLGILRQKQGLNQQIATDAFDARSEGAIGILSNFKTAAELQQAQDSGALEQQLAGLYGANGYDKKRVREFADVRGETLMRKDLTADAYKIKQDEIQWTPFANQVRNMVYAGDIKTANDELQKVGDFPQKPEILDLMRQTQVENHKQQVSEEQFNAEQALKRRALDDGAPAKRLANLQLQDYQRQQQARNYADSVGAKYLADVAAHEKLVQQVAKANDLTGLDGKVHFDEFSQVEKDTWNNLVSKNPALAAPSSTKYMEDAIRNAGNYGLTPTDVQTNMPYFQQALTGMPTTLFGRDASVSANNAAVLEAGVKSYTENGGRFPSVVSGKASDGLNTLNSLMPNWYNQNQEATIIGVNYADVFENMAEVINKGIELKDGKVIAVPPELISAALAMEQGATEDSNPSEALTTLIDAAKADGSLEEALNVRIKLSRANNSKAVQPNGAANLKKAAKQK